MRHEGRSRSQLLALCAALVAGVWFPLLAIVASESDGQSHAAVVLPDPVSGAEASSTCPALQRLLRYDTAYMTAVLAHIGTVPIVIAVKEGHAAAAGAFVEDLGGTIERREVAVGYLRATLPTTAVPALACSVLVDVVEINNEMRVDDMSLSTPADADSRERTAGRVRPPEARALVGAMPAGAGHQPTLTFPLVEMRVEAVLTIRIYRRPSGRIRLHHLSAAARRRW